MENAKERKSHGSTSHQDNHRKDGKKKWQERSYPRPPKWNRTPLRVMAEAPTTEEVNYYVDTITAVVKDEIGID